MPVNEKDLPSICKEHPTAQIRHEWDETRFRCFPNQQGAPLCGNHVYSCAECGKRLCSPEEFERRKKVEARDAS